MTDTSTEKEQTASNVTPESGEDYVEGEEPFIQYETLHVDRWLGEVYRRRRAREPLDFHLDASGNYVANARASGAVFTVVARVQVIAAEEPKDRHRVMVIEKGQAKVGRGEISASGSGYGTSDEDVYRTRQRKSWRDRQNRRDNAIADPYSIDRPFILPPKPKIDYHIEITSKSLIQAINLIVKQGDDISMRDDILEVKAPYASLMYNHASLKEYQQRHHPETITEDSCAIAADMYSHLELLLSFLGEPTPCMKAEMTASLRIEFDDLWQLFSPGTPILRSIRAQRSPAGRGMGDPLFDLLHTSTSQGLHGRKQSMSPQLVDADFADGTAADHFAFTGAVVKRCYVPNDKSSPAVGTTADKVLAVDSQGLSYNGNTIITTAHTDYFGGFNGSMDIKDLVAFPLVYADSVKEGTSAMQYLMNRGKSYTELRGLHCKWHDGAVSRYPHYRLEGLVQVDQASCLEQHPELHEQSSGKSAPSSRSGKTKQGKRRTEILCSCAHCTAKVKRKGSKLLSQIRNATQNDQGALEKCLFTFPAHITVYVFKTREWTPVYVTNLSEPEFRENMIDTLVMDDKRRRMLQALSRRFVQYDGKSQTTDTWAADFVKGKGANFCTLCHGPPGVGKTYTAECIAQYTKRPLITLTSGDIGVDPLRVQDALTNAFTQSKRWNAILLIDEADIYLERRSLQDLQRNSLVASFLRALDFYEGILFLTTNRVGSFDDAFISRIHVKLHYPPLSNEDRLKIWNNFIDKLKRERKSSMRVMREVYKYISSPEVNDLKLNGREIRNVWQTAVSLAEHEADKDDDGLIKITDDHVHQVVSVTGDFKVYLDDLHVGDEEQRAARRNARNDDRSAA